ncbi:hypothetical protein SCLCIDRAFT_700850 [Scleroderma citrinum Foug A]|uniref:Uncharacterized protein n=1 Tax=Scleroderma citrinum Foug A TaxID=1036808 RepID=A0A0C3EMG9_9AGAM|nr:hypothetical protein SCLCIDRAFT_700850 [Scleroderma citrinum Foug A]
MSIIVDTSCSSSIEIRPKRPVFLSDRNHSRMPSTTSTPANVLPCTSPWTVVFKAVHGNCVLSDELHRNSSDTGTTDFYLK